MPTVAYQGPTPILAGATATGAGSTYEVNRKIEDPLGRVFQAVGTTSSGAGAATVLVQVSCDNVNWLTLATITLTLATTASSDGFASIEQWPYVRGNVSSISGTGAAVTLYMGL